MVSRQIGTQQRQSEATRQSKPPKEITIESSDLDLGWRERLQDFTWTWFTLSMATGGVANVIHSVPFRFTGLYAIGCIFMILDLVLFLMNCLAMSLRCYYWPSTFRASFLYPTESLFIPASVISAAIILSNICEYGLVGTKTGPWLAMACTALFWIYIGLAFIFSIGIYVLMWSTQTFHMQVTSIWIFPAYPLLLVGPIAGVLSTKTTTISIIVGGVIVQGVGFTVATMIYSAWMYRLMTQGLPAEDQRPGMFVSVGPAGFTVSGLINMGHNIPSTVPADFMGNGELAGQVAKMLAYWAGIWIWGLAVFFFFASVLAHWSCISRARINFSMTWWALVFPNSALVTSTFAVAKALNGNYVLEVVACVMTCILIVVWIVVFGLMIRAVVLKQILWPQKTQNKDTDVAVKKTGLRLTTYCSRTTATDIEVGEGIESCVAKRDNALPNS